MQYVQRGLLFPRDVYITPAQKALVLGTNQYRPRNARQRTDMLRVLQSDVRNRHRHTEMNDNPQGDSDSGLEYDTMVKG